MKILIGAFFLLGILSILATAQTGGSYDLSYSVIASGGGTSIGSTFTVDGTIGQGVAGTLSTSSSPQFILHGGFWTGSQFAPTAAPVSVGGRVVTASGTPVFRAQVQIIDASGAIRSWTTNQFGRFRFDDLDAGQTYIIQVRHRQMQFAPLLLSVRDNVTDLEIRPINRI
jgi:hypothetical protein